MVREFRREDDATPIILMGYLNPDPVLRPGALLHRCRGGRRGRADHRRPAAPRKPTCWCRTPPRTGSTSSASSRRPPTTRACRWCSMAARASSTTSASPASPARAAASVDELAAAIPRIRRVTDLPIAIGFGVRTPAQAAEAVRVADAAVVASALIDTLAENLDAQGAPAPTSSAACSTRCATRRRRARPATE